VDGGSPTSRAPPTTTVDSRFFLGGDSVVDGVDVLSVLTLLTSDGTNSTQRIVCLHAIARLSLFATSMEWGTVSADPAILTAVASCLRHKDVAVQYVPSSPPYNAHAGAAQ
jgi:hypothetical protein